MGRSKTNSVVALAVCGSNAAFSRSCAIVAARAAAQHTWPCPRCSQTLLLERWGNVSVCTSERAVGLCGEMSREMRIAFIVLGGDCILRWGSYLLACSCSQALALRGRQRRPWGPWPCTQRPERGAKGKDELADGVAQAGVSVSRGFGAPPRKRAQRSEGVS